MKAPMFLCVVMFLCIISGCATQGENLIMDSYNDKEKSILLSNKGLQLYGVMVERDDITLIPNIEEILKESLKFYSGNEDAGVFLKKAENFGALTVVKGIKTARKNLAIKIGRTEEDDYSLCLVLRKIHQIEPANVEVITLLDKTKNVKEKLAKKMLTYGDAQLGLIGKIKNKLLQGKAVILVLGKYDRAILLGTSQENNLMMQRVVFENVLSKDMDAVILETKALMVKAKYRDAETRLKILNKYNLYVNHKYDDRLIDLQYRFYFSWAKILYGSNQIDLASEKNDLALSLVKSVEALALQGEIKNRRANVDVAASFDDWILEIDGLLEQKEIALANQKINSIKAITHDKEKLEKLAKKKAEVRALVEVVYNDAVADFVNGNYSSAIKGFENTLAVTRDYKNAGNYRKKAKSELRILALY